TKRRRRCNRAAARAARGALGYRFGRFRRCRLAADRAKRHPPLEAGGHRRHARESGADDPGSEVSDPPHATTNAAAAGLARDHARGRSALARPPAGRLFGLPPPALSAPEEGGAQDQALGPASLNRGTTPRTGRSGPLGGAPTACDWHNTCRGDNGRETMTAAQFERLGELEAETVLRWRFEELI